LTKIYKKNTYKMIQEFWTEVKTKTAELESLTCKPLREEKDYTSQTEFLKIAATKEKDLEGFNELLCKFNIKPFDYKSSNEVPTK